ncbi:MAG: Secretion system C-terminal sorting domain [Bacteroidota bacterium]|jgi:hypothetical protein
MIFTSAFAQSPCAFTYTLVPGNNGEVQFNGTYPSGCIEYEEWVLGDGTRLQEVSDPRHLYLAAGISINGVFTVTHIVQYQGTVYTCQQTITVTLNPYNDLCRDRYFGYDVDGCTLTLGSTLNAVTTPLDVTISFGDDSPPVTNQTNVTHSYAAPGTYNVSQNYIIYDDMGGVLAQGVCTRPVTVGCCCTIDPPISVDFVLDCGMLKMKLGTDVCCELHKCQTLSVIYGDMLNPKFLDICNLGEICITDYSTYGNNQSNFIKIEYRSFCHGQPVVKTLNVKPSFEGIFLGLNPSEPTLCSPTNGIGTDACPFYTSNLSQYESNLMGTILNGPASVFVAPNSIIQVDKSFSFIGNINIVMGKNSGWNVLGRPTASTGYTLEINNGVSISGSCCLWRGIYVYGNGMFMSQQGQVNASNNSISDALYAVRLFSQQNTTPRLVTRNTTYSNNFISIRGTDGRFNLISSGEAFRQNTFTSSGLLCIEPCLNNLIDVLPPGLSYQQTRSYAGIFLKGGAINTPGVTNLLNLTIPPVSDNRINTFSNLANGILASDLTLDIQDCAYFDNMQQGGYSFGGGYGVRWFDNTGNFDLVYRGLTDVSDPNLINGVGFNNCATGIRAASLVPNNPSNITIRGCGMNTVGNGVELNANQGDLTGSIHHNRINSNGQYGVGLFDMTPSPSNIQIMDNTLNASPGIGVWIVGPDFSGPQQVEIGPNNLINATITGINAFNYSRAYIHENTILGTGAGGSGILATGGVSEIECNTIGGNYFYGVNVIDNEIHKDLSFNTISNLGEGIRMDGTCPAENFIKCNTLTNNLLSYANLAITGQQFNTGNTWVNTGAFADGSVNVGLSRYFIPLGTTPMTVTPITGWFIQNPSLSIPQCTKTCVANIVGGGGGIKELDKRIADGNLSVNDWQKWKLERYLYRQLDGNTVMQAAEPSFQSFWSTKANQPIGRLGEVNRQAASIFSLGIGATTVNNNQMVIQAELENLKVLDQQMTATEDAAVLGVLYNTINTKTQLITAAINQNTALLTQAKSTRIAAAQTIQTGLQQVPTTATYENNEKTVLSLYLQTLAIDVLPTSAQLSTLYEIAIQCPRSGGPAVYFAGSIWQSCTGQLVQSGDCSKEAQGSNGDRNENITASISERVQVYPNPVNDNLLLSIPTKKTISHWAIFDTFGRLLKDDHALLDGIKSIPTQSLQNGMFFLHLTTDKGTTQVIPFTVQH